MDCTQKQLEALVDRIARRLPKEVGEAGQNLILDELVAFCETIDPTLESIDAKELLWCVAKIAELKSKGEPV